MNSAQLDTRQRIEAKRAKVATQLAARTQATPTVAPQRAILPPVSVARPAQATQATQAPAQPAQAAQAKLDHLAVTVATLQRENRRLRRMTKSGKMGRTLYRAADDAGAIVGWRIMADLSVTRRNVAGYGMSRQRHAWAVALLILAGVVDQHDSTVWLDDAFLVDDAAQAHAMIDATVAMLAAGNDLDKLRRHLPAHLQRGKRPPGSAGSAGHPDAKG